MTGVRDGAVRVLIVDDEPELTELLSWAVKEAGWQPFLAADGRGALSLARGCAPHAVVLDGMLPDLDGLHVLRRLRYEDARLPVLAELFHSEKIVPATVSFVDIAGIVKGASQGEGMGNAFLSHIREADAVCQVTRVFADADVTHVDGRVDPGNDIDTITTELILADLQTLEKALPRLEKEARIKKESQPKFAAWQEALRVLESGKGVYAAGLDPEPLRELFLLTAKPFLYVFNCDQDELAGSFTGVEMTKETFPNIMVSFYAFMLIEIKESNRHPV